ncbi:N-acetyl-gamma-glutamyl-phosphate reductase [Hymenobacter sp. UV11]|uniref:N-acetyl-gamma-glutamyl-phosphate reductase n=1 Tax=Hymenobacter sp. UV11 TaxID=1849735 RepID=UPI00105E5701|nr:N-acetyl-gamma-glutamyl-phosphate reductase [Hymenobacter sp. UV11]TDN38224.1 N-acetyl-gamma-glutamyl-phosphate reductase [Hymenobacter sp. UV11]TFZ67600.1 N-acetyl-gamma-glutamyl-phosphate reductase [Hymenobacter sp. UV11]
MSKLVKAGIVGGAGYTAGELVRLLLHHPQVEIGAVVSSTQAGQPLHSVHDDLLGDTDLTFASELTGDEDVVFLCLGHGNSREWLLKTHLPPSTKVIDLSNDFRLAADRDVAGRHFVYGLPELNREQIRTADSIANPGCFASAIQLALLPLAAAGQLHDAVHVSAITGSTGAGRGLVETTGYTWRTGNISTYKTFTHQHLGEIGETLVGLQTSFAKPVRFIPYRGNFTRGIFASVYTTCELLVPEVQELYADYYRDAPFTIVSEKEIHLKQVVNTNKCLLHVAKHDDQVLITSALDNLLKGASGQAIQNMNLMFGLEETAGLGIKASFF